MDKFYTTKKLLGDKKAELWRQFISETFVELDCNGMSSDNFFGELRARNVGELGISRITTDAYDVFRTDNRISDSNDDEFIVSVQTAGSSTIRQLGREVTLYPGDFTIYDATMPYHLHFANRLSQLVVKIPRDHLQKYMNAPESMTALHIKGGQGVSELTANFASKLFDEAINLEHHTQNQVADTLVALITTSIREATAELERAPRNRATQLLRIKQFIAKNLRSEELTIGLIATEFNISERYVQTLFESESLTPSRYIWSERLKAAETDLANPLLAHRSVSEICYAWAFNDTSHFSRAFKKKFGLSPRQYRKMEF